MTLAILLRRKARMVNSASSGQSSTSRISTSCDMQHLSGEWKFQRRGGVVLGRTDGEGKGRAAIELGFGPNAPTVFANDALGNGQAHARAFKITSLVQALKNAK